jgi:hypothetical protein
MQQRQLQPIIRGLEQVFNRVGQNLTWYKYSGSAAGSPEFGEGVTVTYGTAEIRAIVWQGLRQIGGLEIQHPGGASQQGSIQCALREPVGPDDMLDFANARWRLEGEGTPVFLGATHYYRSVLRRAH